MTERERVREWFINGGNGFEDGEDGARAVSFTFEGMVECAEAYARERVLTELESVAQEMCPYCKQGKGYIVPYADSGKPYHTFSNDTWVDCDAAPIRQRIATLEAEG